MKDEMKKKKEEIEKEEENIICFPRLLSCKRKKFSKRVKKELY